MIIPEGISHVFVLLSPASRSFCYYSTPTDTIGNNAFIPEPAFLEIIALADEKKIALTFVYGDTPPPFSYDQTISSSGYARIVPYRLAEKYPNAVTILDDKDFHCLLKDNPATLAGNVILRCGIDHIDKLPRIIHHLAGVVRRINCILLDYERYTEDAYTRYIGILAEIDNVLLHEYRNNNPVEISIASDLLGLTQMRDCSAGVTHLTLAPDGLFYICPAFYCDSTGNTADLSKTLSALDNPRLLKIENAPLCVSCECYHCKRCAYLNKKMTLEINIPSKQQCVLSHCERENTLYLGQKLANEGIAAGQTEFIHNPVLDPIEKFTHKQDISNVTLIKVLSDIPRLLEKYRMKEAADFPKEQNADRSIIGKVTQAERDEIRGLFERKNGLSELFKTMTGMKADELASSPLYQKALDDMGKTTTLFDEWWNRMKEKYGWELKPKHHFVIDFDSCEIRVTD